MVIVERCPHTSIGFGLLTSSLAQLRIDLAMSGLVGSLVQGRLCHAYRKLSDGTEAPGVLRKILLEYETARLQSHATRNTI